MSSEFGLESLNLMSKFHIQRPLIKVPNFQLSCKETHTNHKQTRVQTVVKKKKNKRQDYRVQNMSNVINLSYPKIIECKMYLV